MSEFAEGYAVGQGNNGCNGMWGGEWIWIIVLFALWQNGGFGFGSNGACATQADLAAGFNNSAVLNNLGEIKLGQTEIISTMIKEGCDTRHAICNSTRDIIDNANANTRSILDFLVQDKIAALTAENQNLKFQASQSQQNAYIAATIDATRAELIRRLGAEYPSPAYVVQPPQPVTFGTNGCGYVYNGNGCGC
jgi:hypothetical protein